MHLPSEASDLLTGHSYRLFFTLSFRSLFLKLGGEEVEYDPGFQLYIQTKLSNPHYKPEIAAQVCCGHDFLFNQVGTQDTGSSVTVHIHCAHKVNTGSKLKSETPQTVVRASAK